MSYENYKILVIIPARSGSKGIIDKNIKYFSGKPLMYWTIKQALESRYSTNMRVIVSTDSEKYRQIAIECGAEAPFLRPIEIAQDLSTDYECVKHCLQWLNENDGYVPDFVVQLRPTQPCRNVSCIDKCIKLFINGFDKYDSLRSVYEIEKSPYKMYTICDVGEKNELLKPLFDAVGNIKEPYNQCRQVLPKCYLHNGYIDIFKASIVADGTISGKRIYPYVMTSSDCIDIDTAKDWKNAENNFCI